MEFQETATDVRQEFLPSTVDRLLARVKQDRFLRIFTTFTRVLLALGFVPSGLKSRGMNYRTKAEYFIQGITQGFVEASEVIAWSDEVVVAAATTEDWMLEISSCGPADRMVILSHLNTVKGVADPVALAALLKAKGLG